MLLIFFQIWKSNNPFFYIFDINFIEDITKEIVCEQVSLIDVHCLVAFIHISDIAVNAVKNKVTKIKLGFDLLYLMRKDAQQIPENSPYMLAVLQLFIDTVIRNRSIA